MASSSPSSTYPSPYTNTSKHRYTIMKAAFIITIVSLLTFGWSTSTRISISIPVGKSTHRALKAMETFFPETRTRPLPIPKPVPDAIERLRMRNEEIALEKMRDEWAALKYRMMNAQDQDEQEKERVLEVGEKKKEDSDEEEEEKEEEVEARFYTQLELANSTDAKRGLLNWVMQMEYAGQTFFDGFDFFTEPDPSNGFVNYVGKDKAIAEGLAFWTDAGIPGIQAEHWSQLPAGQNRDSVRITSHALYSGGLFLIDLALMPWGCGVWPAFWLLGYGAPWPTVGEIDFIEGIHGMTNKHANPGCVVNTTKGLYSGTVTNPVCDHESGGTGCGIVSPSQSSFGEPFNAAGGGVFGMLWDGTGIRMWSWNRAQIPNDIIANHPSPASWGTPHAAYDASTCDPYKFFSAQTLVLNVNLCGDWAGGLYSQFPYCPGTCRSQIENPANLVNTVMLINYIRVYQLSGAPSNIVGQTAGNANLTGACGPGQLEDNGVEGDVGGDISGLYGGAFFLIVVVEIGLVLLY